MGAGDVFQDAAGRWDIATPARRTTGVRMAGFRLRVEDEMDLRVVPYPAVTLVVDLGGGLSVERAGGGRQRGSVVAGMAPGTVRGIGRDVECLQIRLSPVVAHRVLRGARELAGAVVGLEDLWGRDARRIQERLHAAGCWQERFAIAEAALARRAGGGRPVDPEVAFAWHRLVATRGLLRVEALAAETGWGRQRLWSRFRSQIGVSPKYAARLIRFDHATHRLAAGHSVASVAADGGYADQAHLHRDVRSFGGATPTAVAGSPWLAVDDIAWTPDGRDPAAHG